MPRKRLVERLLVWRAKMPGSGASHRRQQGPLNGLAPVEGLYDKSKPTRDQRLRFYTDSPILARQLDRPP
jgi:hypothetical protein